MRDRADVVVVGGGAAGCAVAYYLSRAGVASTVIERDGVASQASGFAAGGLNPLEGAGIPGPLAPLLAIESFRMHQAMWDELQRESGVDFQPGTVSTVRLAFDEAELNGMDETLRVFEAAEGFSARYLDSAELHELEPRIALDAVGALYMYGNTALDSYRYTLALSMAAERRGAEFRSAIVSALKTTGGRVEAVATESSEIGCDALVLGMGPWSAQAEPWLGVRIPVEPLKGEILRVRLPGPELKHDLAWGHSSIYHRSDGLAWIGATEERRGFDARPSEEARQSLLADAVRIMPAIADAELVMHTACLRPVTPDWLPIIGKAPGWENVYLATGAGKKGILLSPGIGKAVSDLIAHGTTTLPVDPFTPARHN
jgi:glycine oxidase